MKISTLLDHIDTGHIALPEFQRGYVWNRDQVRGLFDSLYHRHPVGSLLVWATESKGATYRGDGQLSAGVVKLLLDGQQRITSLYGVVRGKPPKFFDGNEKAFSDLQFNLDTENFMFYQPIKMKDYPTWIDVSKLMKNGHNGFGTIITNLSQIPDLAQKIPDYSSKISKLLGITEIDLHVEEVTGNDKSIDVVVDIFNRVNSGGTKLSKGDLALAKICADWAEARDTLKEKLSQWKSAGYDFNLDWLLRSVNTVLTGEAKFLYLHDKSAEDIKKGLQRAAKHIETCLNMISGRLGLDHERVFFSKLAIPVMVRYLDQKKGLLTEKERDKLLFWYLQSGMWGRFSGSTESFIDKDVEAISKGDGNLDNLLEQLRLWHGGMRVEAGHFTGWSLGARFYPVLYWLTRMGEARDWGTGLPLKGNLLGNMNRLEVHHIFPKSQLYKKRYGKAEVNSLANFCFLTKETNLIISDRLPEKYFPEIEEKFPGALSSQWIPQDPHLWRIEKFDSFCEERKNLLTREANNQLSRLLHGDTFWLESQPQMKTEILIPGSISDADEEKELNELNEWIESIGLPKGTMSFELTNIDNGESLAILDLAWPNGIQEELSEPVAVILNESVEMLGIASQAGFKFFTSGDDFKAYVKRVILGEGHL